MAAGSEVCCGSSIHVMPNATAQIYGVYEYTNNGDRFHLRCVLESLGFGPPAQVLGNDIFNFCACLVEAGEVLHCQFRMFGTDAFTSTFDLLGYTRTGVVAITKQFDDELKGYIQKVIVFCGEEFFDLFLRGNPWSRPDDRHFL